MELNKKLYEVESTSLIYDNSIQADATVVQVKTPEGHGLIKKGQLLDYADGYCLHKLNGSPSCIAAENVSYAEDDTEVPVQVYTSGAFCAGKIISDVEITSDDIELLRNKNIRLK